MNKSDWHALFAANLNTIMEQHGISGAELARNLDVAPSTVNKWRSGDRTPTAIQINNIANFFGISCDELIDVGDHVYMRDSEASWSTFQEVRGQYHW